MIPYLPALEKCIKVDPNAAFYVPAIISVAIRISADVAFCKLWFDKLMDMLDLYKNHQTLNNVMAAILNVVDMKRELVTMDYKQRILKYKQFTDPNVRHSVDNILAALQQERKVKQALDKKIRCKVQYKAEKRIMALDAALAFAQVQDKMLQAFQLQQQLGMQLTYMDADNDMVTVSSQEEWEQLIDYVVQVKLQQLQCTLVVPQQQSSSSNAAKQQQQQQATPTSAPTSQQLPFGTVASNNSSNASPTTTTATNKAFNWKRGNMIGQGGFGKVYN